MSSLLLVLSSYPCAGLWVKSIKNMKCSSECSHLLEQDQGLAEEVRFLHVLPAVLPQLALASWVYHELSLEPHDLSSGDSSRDDGVEKQVAHLTIAELQDNSSFYLG